MTRLFFGSLPFPNALSRSNSVGDDHERQGVLRTVDCDHYRAVPISDGTHVLFTDPATGLLCLGSNAPLGGPTKLMRKVCMVPPEDPTQNSISLVCYRAGSELRWGVRVVAAYDDGRVVLYNMPVDCFERIRSIKSSLDVWDEFAGVVGQSDLLMDVFISDQQEANIIEGVEGSSLTRQSSHSSASSKTFRSLQVDGTVIYRTESTVDDVQVDCDAGGVRIWIFLRDFGGVRLDMYTPRHFNPVKGYIGVDGLPHLTEDVSESEAVSDRGISGHNGKQRATFRWGSEDGTNDEWKKPARFVVYE